MNDILVLSFAYTTDNQRWAALGISCTQRRVPLHVLGYGKEHPGPCGFQEATEFLKGRSEEYIVITDSFDVICNRWDEDELRMLIDSAPNLIMSVEPLVWPVGAPDTYPSADRYKWRAINGGQYCGRRGDIIVMWSELMALWRLGARAVAPLGGSSQEILHRMYAAPDYFFTLDLECRIFQTMIGENAKFVEATFKHGRAIARNSITKSYPMFLHFNGGKPQSPTFEDWKAILL